MSKRPSRHGGGYGARDGFVYGGVPVAPRIVAPSSTGCRPRRGAGGKPKPASCGTWPPSCRSRMRRLKMCKRPHTLGLAGSGTAPSVPCKSGKEHLYSLLKKQGLYVYLYSGIVTSQLREQYSLSKTDQKNAQTFSSHAVDAWVLAAATCGATTPTSTRLWYSVPTRRVRRQLHAMEPEKGGRRSPYGGTRSFGFTRGTLVHHPRYGRCLIGGWDRTTHCVSLHTYKNQHTPDATGQAC